VALHPLVAVRVFHAESLRYLFWGYRCSCRYLRRSTDNARPGSTGGLARLVAVHQVRNGTWGPSRCSAACLAMVAPHHGHHTSVTGRRDLGGTDKDGLTLNGLLEGAVALGFDAQALTGSAEHFVVELLDPIDAFRKRSFDEMSEST
jgi:hypothetical protein